MVFIHIDQKNCMDGNCDNVARLDSYLGNKNTKTFILIFMEGCGPCNATRPEWSKIKNVLSPKMLNRNDIVIAAIDHKLAEKLANLKSKPSSFPTMKFIADGGITAENYEDSKIVKKDRTIDSFIEWIHLKTGETSKHNTKKHNNTKKRNTKKRNTKKRNTKKHHKKYPYNKTQKQRGGKWSLKYKKSINCNRPKGFSQKQHCKYGRK
jgi:hypothetical protein